MANIRIKDLSTTAAVTASDDFIAVDGATNGTRKLDAYSPTFGGNLTVSGNGLNTFGGTGATNASILFGANNVANAAAGYLSISQRLNYGYALFGYNMTGTSGSDTYTSPKNATGSAGVELIGGSSGITRFIYSTAATTAGNALTVTEAARFSSGNLLLKSDGIDGGNGKLQLATHTTSAGGIGFGTSTSLFTDTARLVLVGGTTTRFRLLSTSGNAADFQFDNSELAIGNSSSIRFYTTGGTALTLDTGQNATFAGTIASSVARTAGATFLFANTDNTTGTSSSRLWATTGGGTGGDPILTLTVNGATDWTLGVDNSDSDKFKINNAFGLGTSDKLVLDGSGNMTIAGSLTTSAPTGGAGAWELGVYSATAPTATGYVTIEIGGVQYKLLAST